MKRQNIIAYSTMGGFISCCLGFWALHKRIQLLEKSNEHCLKMISYILETDIECNNHIIKLMNMTFEDDHISNQEESE